MTFEAVLWSVSGLCRRNIPSTPCPKLRIRDAFSKIGGYLFAGPYNKDCNILGSILGSPI